MSERNKIGICAIVNTLDSKVYIGSSVNLGARFVSPKRTASQSEISRRESEVGK